MAEAKPQRQRTSFTEAEKVRLLEIVNSFSDIIKNTRTDANSSKAKEAAWLAVVDALNEQSTAAQPRTVKQLTTLYKNAKRDAKKHLALDKVNMYITCIICYQTIKKKIIDLM